MLEFLGEFERAAGDLYAWRWVVAIGATAVLAAGLVTVARLRIDRWLWSHRLVSAAGAALALAVVVPAAWYALSPLWERSRLDEASPLAVSTPVSASTPVPTDKDEPVPAPFTARITHSGTFAGADDFHFGRGDALLIETAPGMHTLRLEEFSVRNGPDLFVYLANDPDDVSGAVNLGTLKATDGNFNYDVPSDIDPSAYRYAIVWCRQFSVLFASAELQAT